MKIGLLLEGGAMRGLYTAGVLEELMENNIEVDGIECRNRESRIYKTRKCIRANGVDDYITKPFHIRELIARIKIVLKRNSNIVEDNIKAVRGMAIKWR